MSQLKELDFKVSNHSSKSGKAQKYQVYCCQLTCWKGTSALPQWFRPYEYPKICCNTLKTTDAGPGVSVSNFEVCFLEMLKLHEYNHQSMFNRNHQAPGDSAQNEAERTNVSIRIGSDALVNGMALKWEYFKSFDDQLTNEELIQKWKKERPYVWKRMLGKWLNRW